MLENANASGWQSLPNPFAKLSKQVIVAPLEEGRNVAASEVITGRVTGRRTDITRIIMDEQSAIFLVGTLRIGKSTLLRYLRQPPDAEWSWRDELADLHGQLNLNDIHFVQIDLTPLEGIKDSNALLAIFIRQCLKALYSVYHRDEQTPASNMDLKELRGLLR